MQHAPEQTAGAAHTPGPWEVVEASEHHGFYVTSQFGNTICDLYTMSRPDMPAAVNGGPSKPVPFLAGMDGPNARLIAATPDGLELAEDAVPILEANLEFREELTGEEDEILRDLIDRTKAFIAKARGQ